MPHHDAGKLGFTRGTPRRASQLLLTLGLRWIAGRAKAAEATASGAADD